MKFDDEIKQFRKAFSFDELSYSDVKDLPPENFEVWNFVNPRTGQRGTLVIPRQDEMP